jgi:hypothetical protein
VKGDRHMENVKQVAAEKGEEKKSGFGKKFMNFLAMGGIMVILIGGVGIFILISILTK